MKAASVELPLSIYLVVVVVVVNLSYVKNVTQTGYTDRRRHVRMRDGDGCRRKGSGRNGKRLQHGWRGWTPSWWEAPSPQRTSSHLRGFLVQRVCF